MSSQSLGFLLNQKKVGTGLKANDCALCMSK